MHASVGGAAAGDRARRVQWGWASYSVCNNVYAVNVPLLYMSVWVISDLAVPSVWYGAAISASSLLVALTVPVLCARSDESGRRFPWILGFTALCVGMTLAIGLLAAHVGVPRGGDPHRPATATIVVLAAFALSRYGYQAALPFYQTMLGEIAPPSVRGRLSGLAVSASFIGTLGGALVVAPFFNGRVPLVNYRLPAGVLHALRTIVPLTASGGRAAVFAPTALLVGLCAVPFALLTNDRGRARPQTTARATGLPGVRRDIRSVVDTVRDSGRHAGVRRFLAASLLYQDASGTIVAFMAVYAVRVMHFAAGGEVTLFAALSVPAIVGSYACGRLVDRVGARRAMLVVLGTWIALFTTLTMITGHGTFWTVAVLLGFVFGGLEVVERPLLLQLAPPHEAGRLFGLLFLSGSAATIVGPLVWGTTVDGLSPALGTSAAYRVALATMVGVLGGAFWLVRGLPRHRQASSTAIHP